MSLFLGFTLLPENNLVNLKKEYTRYKKIGNVGKLTGEV